MKWKRILILDDDPVTCNFLKELLTKEGYEVFTTTKGHEALKLGREMDFNLVISDIRLDESDGFEILKTFRKMKPSLPIILITAFGSVEGALEAIKEGAFDYISKPFRIDDLLQKVSQAIERSETEGEEQIKIQTLRKQYDFSDIVGINTKMLEIFKTVARIANSKSTVLIQGESGTGKEVVARAIHLNSPRASKPFIVINCSSIPETLLESELFGYVKGAFTGATINKKGLLEEAHHGTCFMDEIGDLPQSVQIKLLRFLQDHRIRRIGSNEEIEVDVRIVAATNRNLEELVKRGIFREDLYYRLNVVNIHIPPLRERKDDIPVLVEHFIRKYGIENNRKVYGISDDAMKILLSYDWPGNVRELENVIQRAVTLSHGPIIRPEDLPNHLYRKEPFHIASEELLPLREIQKRYIMKVLEKTGGNKTKAAEILGINRKTLYRIARRYGIDLSKDNEN